MVWNIKGSYIETWSCDFFCPCNFSLAGGADYDYCRIALVFNLTEGNVDGTDVGSLAVAAIADTPKVMTDERGSTPSGSSSRGSPDSPSPSSPGRPSP